MAKKTHDSTNYIAQQFCSLSYPGNFSSLLSDIVSLFIIAFYLKDRTYLSNNFLLAEKTHDSTNNLVQKFCSRSYPGNSSSIQPRHCFIVYNCFLYFRIVPTDLITFCWLRTHRTSTNNLVQQYCSRSYPGNSSSIQPRHCFIVCNCFLIFRIVPTYQTTFCWPRRHTIRLTTLFSSSAHVLILVTLLLFSPDIVSLFIIAFLSLGSYLLI